MIHPQVADFGMSMNIRDNHSHVSGVRHGTPLYVAPEILKNGKASKSADVYSFGVILWELFHGTLAWQHLAKVTGAVPQKKALLNFHGNVFTYAEGSLAAYAELGRACLSEDPAARPTFEQLHHALERAAMQPQLTLRPGPGCKDSASLVRAAAHDGAGHLEAACEQDRAMSE